MDWFHSVSFFTKNDIIYWETKKINYEKNYDFYQQLKAKNKYIYWFEHSAHTVTYTEPDLFQQIIIDKVLPESFK